MQLASFRVRFTAGQLRRRNAHVARRKAAGHYDQREFALMLTRPKKQRRYKLSFAALRDRLYRRDAKASNKARLAEAAAASA